MARLGGRRAAGGRTPIVSQEQRHTGLGGLQREGTGVVRRCSRTYERHERESLQTSDGSIVVTAPPARLTSGFVRLHDSPGSCAAPEQQLRALEQPEHNAVAFQLLPTSMKPKVHCCVDLLSLSRLPFWQLCSCRYSTHFCIRLPTTYGRRFRVSITASYHTECSPVASTRVSTSLDRQHDDIVLGDLTATLEKHRASNIASIIRYTEPSKAPRPAAEERDESTHPSHLSSEDTLKQPRETIKRPLKKGRRRSIDAKLLGNDLSFSNLQKQRDLSKGIYIRPEAAPDSQKILQPWTLDKSEVPFDKRDRINREIEKVATWMANDAHSKTLRKQIRTSTVELLKRRVPHAGFHEFGSDMTDLATVTSDIDIGVFIPSKVKTREKRQPSQFSKVGRAQLHSILKDILDEVRRVELFKDECIVAARFPLVSAIHKASLIPVQIVSCNPEPQRTELTMHYLSEFRNLRPLYLFLKGVLNARGLDEVQFGGIGSYTLLMMIVTCLKISKSSRKDDLCTSLMTFLHFYGNLNTERQAIAAEPAMFYGKHPDTTESINMKAEMDHDLAFYWRHRLSAIVEEKPWLLCLQDPAEMSNDLGRSSYRYMDVKKVFFRLNTILRAWLANREGSTHPLEEFFGNRLQQLGKPKMGS